MKIFKFARFAAALLILLVFAGCEDSSTTLVSIPNVNIECSSSLNSECDADLDGNDVVVIMSRSGCGDSVSYEPVASGSSNLECDGTGCTATVDTWFDDNSNSVTEVITGRMDVCSRITVAASNVQSSADLVSEESEDINDSQSLLMSVWSSL